MPTRLRVPDIVARKKHVHRASSFRTTLKLGPESSQFRAFQHIVTCIANGTPLPDGYYRSMRHGSPDELLETYGIMHLHLGDPTTNELLFLIQYEKFVVLLEISDHSAFATDPVGAVLRKLHEGKVAELYADLERIELERVSQVRASLGRKRSGTKGDSAL